MNPTASRAPGGVPLLCLHGAGGSARSFEPLVHLLGARYAVTSVNLPGHGGTAPMPTPSLEGYARWLVEELRSRVDPPILVGHSMGTLIGMLAALEAPEHLAGLVLLAGGASLHVTPFVHELVAQRFGSLPSFLARAGFSSTTPRAEGERLASLAVDAPQSVVQADFSALTGVDLSPMLHRIGLPALVVVATEDRMVPPTVTAALGDALPGARTVTLPQAGHMLHLERPAEVAAVIDDWIVSHAIARQEAGARPGDAG